MDKRLTIAEIKEVEVIKENQEIVVKKLMELVNFCADDYKMTSNSGMLLAIKKLHESIDILEGKKHE